MANSERPAGTRQRVLPDDGRWETGWLLLAIALILLVGASLLQFNRAAPFERPAHLQLSVTGKALLTALRNAGDEILFLAEPGAELPSVAELADQGLPPFAATAGPAARYRWQRLDGRCYVGAQASESSDAGRPDAGSPDKPAEPQFLLRLQPHSEVYWRSAAHPPPTHCDDLEYWQALTP